MIGNIETVEIKIDENIYLLTKLYAKESYPLYLKCALILAPLLNVKNKKEMEPQIEKVMALLSREFNFEEVIHLLKSSGVRKNYKEINDSEWSVTSPILILELFAHVLKLNVVNELLNKKKDFGQIVERLFGSQTFANI